MDAPKTPKRVTVAHGRSGAVSWRTGTIRLPAAPPGGCALSSLCSQDAASCLVDVMPRVMKKAGLVDQVPPLEAIGPGLTRVGQRRD